jgi:hypothetical protein
VKRNVDRLEADPRYIDNGNMKRSVRQQSIQTVQDMIKRSTDQIEWFLGRGPEGPGNIDRRWRRRRLPLSESAIASGFGMFEVALPAGSASRL